MFNNIGAKIQGLAKFTAWLGIAGSIIVGLFYASFGYDPLLGEATPFIGLSIIIFGSLSSLMSSWMLYGFGELIIRVTEVSTLNKELVTLKRGEMSSFSTPRQ